MLADLTIVPSGYAEATIREFYPHKDIARAYGVTPNSGHRANQ
jgi:hypothetical protein